MKKSLVLTGFLAIFTVIASGCSIRMEADSALNDQNYAKAIDIYQQYLKERPNDWKTRVRYGYALMKDGEYDKSLEQFDYILNEHDLPDYSRSWAIFYSGLNWLYKKDRAKAISTWKQYNNEYNRRLERMIKNEIARQEMLMRVEESEAYAKKAVAEEKDLDTFKTEPDCLAVLYFENIAGDPQLEAFQKAMASMVISDLAKIKGIKVVERIKMQALLAEMTMAQSVQVSEASAPKAGRMLGAGKLVAGTMDKGSIVISPTIMSTSSDKTIGTFTVKGPEEEFFNLQKQVVQSVVKILGVSLSESERESIATPGTKNYEAFTLYGKGLVAFDQKKYEVATQLFQQAVEKDPDFELARKILLATPGGEGGASDIGPPAAAMSKAAGMPSRSSACGN